MTACHRARAVGAALMLGVCGAVQAATLCVFDLVGTTGDAFNASKDYVLAMQRENVSFDLKAFPNEARAVEGFKAGRCDALFATGLRTRHFNLVAGSIDTYGSTTIVRNGRLDINASYEVLRKLLQIYAADSAQAQALMVQGRYEVGGIAPIGAAYLLAKDRRINSVEAMKGKRVMSMEYDRALQLIRKAETIDVSASLWLDLTPEATYRYNLMLQEARIDMARQGIYDKRALRIMKKVRCHVNPTDNECKARKEEDWN